MRNIITSEKEKQRRQKLKGNGGGRPQSLNEEQKNKTIAMHNNGENIKKIAENLNVSTRTIYRILKK